MLEYQNTGGWFSKKKFNIWSGPIQFYGVSTCTRSQLVSMFLVEICGKYLMPILTKTKFLRNDIISCKMACKENDKWNSISMKHTWSLVSKVETLVGKKRFGLRERVCFQALSRLKGKLCLAFINNLNRETVSIINQLNLDQRLALMPFERSFLRALEE